MITFSKNSVFNREDFENFVKECTFSELMDMKHIVTKKVVEKQREVFHKTLISAIDSLSEIEALVEYVTVDGCPIELSDVINGLARLENEDESRLIERIEEVF